MNEEDTNLIAYLMVGGLGLAGAWRLWETRLQPWVNDRMEEVTGSGLENGWVVDAIAIAILIVPVLLLILIVRSVLRGRKKKAAAKKKCDQEELSAGSRSEPRR